MPVSCDIAPLNSLVFIHGARGWTPPLPVDGQLIWSTPSCVVTACFPEVEGPTKIVMGAAPEVNPGTDPAFTGLLETPDRLVAISTVSDDSPILSYETPDVVTTVRIWHSHPRWPEIVTVGLG